MDKEFQVAILEDHPMFRIGIRLQLPTTCHLCMEAATGAEFFDMLASHQPDLVILDLMLPDMNGFDVARLLKKDNSHIKILVMTIDAREETIQQLVEIGVEGFLSKNASVQQFQEALQNLLNGSTYFSRPSEVLEREVLISLGNHRPELFTDREYDIMLALCKGLSNSEIAREMFISPKTVDNHKQHIFTKIGIHNTVQLVTYAVRNKIIILS